MQARQRVLVMGAGGRDFHVFNCLYRTAKDVEVVAFTAAQIPNIDDRRYPPELAGPLYPDGIPILPESDLEQVIRSLAVQQVVFAYSDVSLGHLQGERARVEAAGASFAPFDPAATLIRGTKPCVAICAVRTGCGKSPVARFVTARLRAAGRRVAVIRHPMPYGDLAKQAVQRFASVGDLARHECTVEEMEEYEPHVVAGNVVFAGADYEQVLAAAEAEADVVVWDGGNNDAPFVAPDLLITLLDPLRAGDELAYFPSRYNLMHANVLLITKVDEAEREAIEALHETARSYNPGARVVHGRLRITLGDEALVRGRRALVVEDGPTLTHGGMAYGAGLLAAERAGAAEIVDPRPYARGQIAEAFAAYPHLRHVLPALGYGAAEVADLEATIAATPCDVVVVGTPVDLTRVLRIDRPTVRALYEFEEAATPGLGDVLDAYLAGRGRPGGTDAARPGSRASG